MSTSFVVGCPSSCGACVGFVDTNADNSSTPMKKIEAERLPDLNIPRASHSIFYVNGEVTVVGGHTLGFVPTPTAEYYKDGAWHLINSVYPHDDGMVVVLEGGKRVLIAGGHEKNLGIGQTFEAEMYYPESHTFDGFSCLDRRRAFSQGVELDNGEVLIVGNHQGNDAMELFDGSKTFRHEKDVLTWHSTPYLFPISSGDVMIFGSRWDKSCSNFVPCDTVERLNGDFFRVPLLSEWMPNIFGQKSHTEESFIGDKAKGDYSYIIGAFNNKEERIFILVKDTVFTQIPTTSPIPTTMGYGPFINQSTVVADRNAHKAYMVCSDSTGRAYVFSIEYDKQPAPLTIYYTDPLPDFGNCTPLLTPEGDLLIVGGMAYSNFAPFTSVWLLKVGDGTGNGEWRTENGEARAENFPTWILWVVLGVLVGVGIVVWRRRKNGERKTENGERGCDDIATYGTENTTEDDGGENRAEGGDNRDDGGDSELMARIINLMEKEKVYLKADLQVADMADALGVHRNAVSACINSQQGCSFSQFVNDYRVGHAKRLLSENPDMKIAAVGLDSGFANERTFFRAFKAATDMTPGEWVKKLKVDN